MNSSGGTRTHSISATTAKRGGARAKVVCQLPTEPFILRLLICELIYCVSIKTNLQSKIANQQLK